MGHAPFAMTRRRHAYVRVRHGRYRDSPTGNITNILQHQTGRSQRVRPQSAASSLLACCERKPAEHGSRRPNTSEHADVETGGIGKGPDEPHRWVPSDRCRPLAVAVGMPTFFLKKIPELVLFIAQVLSMARRRRKVRRRRDTRLLAVAHWAAVPAVQRVRNPSAVLCRVYRQVIRVIRHRGIGTVRARAVLRAQLLLVGRAGRAWIFHQHIGTSPAASAEDWESKRA